MHLIYLPKVRDDDFRESCDECGSTVQVRRYIDGDVGLRLCVQCERERRVRMLQWDHNERRQIG